MTRPLLLLCSALCFACAPTPSDLATAWWDVTVECAAQQDVELEVGKSDFIRAFRCQYDGAGCYEKACTYSDAGAKKELNAIRSLKCDDFPDPDGPSVPEAAALPTDTIWEDCDFDQIDACTPDPDCAE